MSHRNDSAPSGGASSPSDLLEPASVLAIATAGAYLTGSVFLRMYYTVLGLPSSMVDIPADIHLAASFLPFCIALLLVFLRTQSTRLLEAAIERPTRSRVAALFAVQAIPVACFVFLLARKSYLGMGIALAAGVLLGFATSSAWSGRRGLLPVLMHLSFSLGALVVLAVPAGGLAAAASWHLAPRAFLESTVPGWKYDRQPVQIVLRQDGYWYVRTSAEAVDLWALPDSSIRTARFVQP